MKAKLFLVGLAMTAFAATGMAQEKVNEVKTTQEKRACFVDKDNNGLCDNFENGTCTIGNGKGLRDGSGNRQGLRDGSGAGRRDGSGRVYGYVRDGRGRAAVRGNRGGRRSGGYGPADGTGNRSYRKESNVRRPMDGTGHGARYFNNQDSVKVVNPVNSK